MRIFLIGLVLILTFSPLSPAGPVPSAAEVTPQVWADTANGASGDFLVILRSQVDLAPMVSAPAGQRDAQVVSSLRQAAETSQAALAADLTARGVHFRAYWIVNLLAVHGDATLVTYLATRPEVAYIEPNDPFKADLETPTTAVSGAPVPAAANLTPEWNLVTVHATDMWAQGFTGQGIVYGNSDTGVQWNHPALINEYRGWNGSAADHNYNWWDAIHASDNWTTGNICGFDLNFPCDDYGHGTHTTGIGVGSGDGVNAIGVAPGAKWIACRNMDGGIGRPSTYIECLQFFMAPTDLNGQNPDPSRHADVISNSYDCPPSEGCGPHSLGAAVQAVRDAGIFMSVSAGNAGSACSSIYTPPALEAPVFTVGSTDSNNVIAFYSSRGPVTIDGSNRMKPELVAPGTRVYSSWAPDSYTTLDGTSMSAPHVAGAVALLWSADRSLKGNVLATELLLESTAQPLTSSQGCGGDSPTAVPNNVYGYGLLNVKAAYDLAMSKLGKVFLPIFFNP